MVGLGGFFYIETIYLQLLSSSFVDSIAYNGGVGYIQSVQTTFVILISNCTFENVYTINSGNLFFIDRK